MSLLWFFTLIRFPGFEGTQALSEDMLKNDVRTPFFRRHVPARLSPAPCAKQCPCSDSSRWFDSQASRIPRLCPKTCASCGSSRQLETRVPRAPHVCAKPRCRSGSSRPYVRARVTSCSNSRTNWTCLVHELTVGRRFWSLTSRGLQRSGVCHCVPWVEGSELSDGSPRCMGGRRTSRWISVSWSIQMESRSRRKTSVQKFERDAVLFDPALPTAEPGRRSGRPAVGPKSQSKSNSVWAPWHAHTENLAISWQPTGPRLSYSLRCNLDYLSTTQSFQHSLTMKRSGPSGLKHWPTLSVSLKRRSNPLPSQLPGNMGMFLDCAVTIRTNKRYMSAVPINSKTFRTKHRVMTNLWLLAQIRQLVRKLFSDLSKDTWNVFLEELLSEDNLLMRREIDWCVHSVHRLWAQNSIQWLAVIKLMSDSIGDCKKKTLATIRNSPTGTPRCQTYPRLIWYPLMMVECLSSRLAQLLAEEDLMRQQHWSPDLSK